MTLFKTNSFLLLLLLLFVSSCDHQSSDTTISQKVKNLIAFSRVYGYVKYFHPSDETRQIGWNKMAVLGVEAVKKADNNAELKNVLDSLFLPIAPTTKISETKPDSGLFLSEYIEKIGQDTSGLKTITWQHLGIDMEQSSRAYASSRINRKDRAWNRNFTLFQHLDAQKLRGSSVQLRVMIRTEVEGPGNEGELFLRVNDKKSRPITIEHKTNSPITSQGWNDYVIESKISNKAHQITAGVKLKREGKLWIDDFQLEIIGYENNETAFTLQNPGFENQYNGRPIGWRSTVTGSYDFKVVSDETFKGSNSFYMASSDPDSPDYLFETHPQVGETAIRQITEGLWIEVPLALYSDNGHTLPKSSETDLNRLKEQLSSIDLNFMSAENEHLRLANVIITWNELQHFYPYFDVIDTDWDRQLTRSIQEALTDTSAKDFYKTLSKLIASLQDGHGRVIHPSIENQAGFPFIVDWIEDKIVVTYSEHPNIKPGDIINSVDGCPAVDIVKSNQKLTSGSPQYTLHRALRQFAFGENGTEAVITIVRDGEVLKHRAKRSTQYNYSKMEKAHLPVLGEIEKGLYYVDLSRASMEQIENDMDSIAHAEAVIFDLRGYPRGNHEIISHLLTEPDTSSQWMQIPKVIYPDQRDIIGYKKYGWFMDPKKPHIEGKVAFITDGRAISYAESFMSFIEHYHLGEIVGQPTAGTNGNINITGLPGDYQYVWTGMKVVKHDGSRHHLIGIQPTVPVEKTIQGVRDGEDEFLERAIEIVQEGR